MYVSMYLKRKHLPAQWHISFDCNNKFLIYLLTCKNSLKQYVDSTQIVSDIAGTFINVMTENLREVRLVCKNIFLNILIVKGIMGSYMTFQLHWLIKLMQKILSNENTAGDINSKRWHLMVFMLKMIVKLELTCIYNPLVPCTDLLLVIIVILVIVSVLL